MSIVSPGRMDSADQRRELTAMEMSVNALYMHEVVNLFIKMKNTAMRNFCCVSILLKFLLA